jgi:hypothetical protein
MNQSGEQKRLKELVLSYRDAKSWPELDALYQLGKVLIADSFIATNIGIRYRIDGNPYVQSVRQELRARGIKDPHRYSEAIDYWFSTRCGPDFEGMVESRIGSLDEKFRLVISELSLYQLSPHTLAGAFDPTWTVRTCSWSIGCSEIETEQKLIETGIANPYHFSSTAFSHRAWDVPDYVQLLLNQVRRSPETYDCPKFDIARIRSLAKDPAVASFVKWVLQQDAGTSNRVWIEEYQFEKELEKEGEQLRGLLAKLAGTGTMTLSYSPARRRVGKRGSRPAECIFWFSPEFIEAVSD